MRVRIISKEGFKFVDLNRRRAIRERCINCSGWSPAEVEHCEHSDCPLHPFRSGQGKQDPRGRADAIRSYCRWCSAGGAMDVARCESFTCPLFPYRQTKVDRSVEIQEEEPPTEAAATG